MTSANFSINGGAVGAKASVSAAGAIVATLDSLDGVNSVEWSVHGTDETTATGDYVLATSGSRGSVCSTTALTSGTALIIKCVVNSGINPRTQAADSNLVKTIKVYVPTASGYEVGCIGETTESDAEYGSVGIINAAIRGISGVTSPVMGIPVRVASTANVANLAAASVSVDGITLVAGDRYLLKDQSTASQNGVYVVGTVSGTAPLTRATDLNTSAEAVPGITFYVQEGTTNGETFWTLTTVLPITLGATSLAFEQKAGSPFPYTAAIPATPSTLLLRDGDGDGFLRDLDVRNVFPSADIIFSSGNASPAITVLEPTGTGAAVGVDLTVQAQQGQAVAAGTNNNGGDLVLASGLVGTGGTGGDDGRVYTQIGSTTAWDVRNTSGVLQQVVDASWSRYDINKASGGIRINTQTAGQTLDLSTDYLQLNTRSNSVIGYVDTTSSQLDIVSNLVDAKFRVLKQSGAGVGTKRYIYISAPDGRDQSGGSNNNDGGDLVLTAGNAGVGGSGTAGAHGRIETIIGTTETAHFAITAIGPYTASELQLKNHGVAALSTDASTQVLAVYNPNASGTVAIAGNSVTMNTESLQELVGFKLNTGVAAMSFSTQVATSGAEIYFDNASSGDGLPLTISGQGGAATNDDGGALVLKSGTTGGGTGVDGDLLLKNGESGSDVTFATDAGLDQYVTFSAASGNLTSITSRNNGISGILELRGAGATVDGVAGIVRIIGADGTAFSSGNAGNAYVMGGDGLDGNGGGVFLYGGDGETNGSGGDITIEGGVAASSNAGGAISIIGGQSGGTGIGGAVLLRGGPGGGTNSVGGAVTIQGGDGTGTGDAGDIFLAPGSAPGDGRKSNIGLLADTGSFGGGEGVIYILNASTVPGSNPSGGGILFSDGGALKWRGSSGTVTTIAPA